MDRWLVWNNVVVFGSRRPAEPEADTILAKQSAEDVGYFLLDIDK
jgi:hypothetical protein